MALFKLPVITIGRKTGGGGQGNPRFTLPSVSSSPRETSHERGSEGGGGQPGESREGAVASRRIEPRIVKSESRSLPNYTGPGPMFLDNAKEVIARCIQAGIIGDSSARDFFRTYSAYLEEDSGEGFDDFLTYAYKDNEEQCAQIASMLNSSLDYPLTRLEVEPGKIATGFAGILEGELLTFCRKMKTPLLTASTSDLLVFGVCNPYLARHVEAAFRTELPAMENSYRYYLLLTPSQMAEAMAKISA